MATLSNAAVGDGLITVRNHENQQQDTADLSCDTDHANNALTPIFDKEKEQQRLARMQAVTQIGMQAMDIVRTQGEIEGHKAAQVEVVKLQAEHPLQYDTPEKVNTAYKQVFDEKMMKYGTGSQLQQGIQAATGALTALAGGDIQKAIAQGAAPYLATLVKQQTEYTGPNGEKDPKKDNVIANTIGHALVGGVVAHLSGQNAGAGAAGAAAGELAARAIMAEMYPGKDGKDLNESERHQLSNLSTIAAGLAGGLTGDSAASTVGGAKAGQNAVENNYLSKAQQTQKDKELAECTSLLDCAGIEVRWAPTDVGQSAAFSGGMLVGVPGELVETVKGLSSVVMHPVATYEAMKSLIVEGNLAEAVKQSYIDRIDHMESEYEKAGATGAYNAGYEFGGMLTEVIGTVGTGGAGAALNVGKTGASLAAKITARAVQIEQAATKGVKVGKVATEAAQLEKAVSKTATLEREALSGPTENWSAYASKEKAIVERAELARNTRQEIISQFVDKNIHPSEFTIKFEGKELKAVPISDGAAIFKGADAGTGIRYFKQIAGIEELPKVKSIPNKGSIYSHTLPDGTKLVLRDFSTSSEKTRAIWTIDIQNRALFKGNGVREVKFQ